MLVKDPVPAGSRPWWTLVRGAGPLIATSIHAGHDVRPEVERLLALTPEERERAEDPFTELWTDIVGSRVVVHRSRLEIDLDRSRDQAVQPPTATADGKPVWRRPLPEEVLDRSLYIHDAFYAAMRTLFDDFQRRYGRFVVLDLHSYNHRGGADRLPMDPAGAPDVNIGTGTMPRRRWAPVVHAFVEAVRQVPVRGRALDVRENVTWEGGYFARWAHQTWPASGCVIAVECKKSYMDEWTGEPDPDALVDLHRALRAGAAAIEAILGS